MGTMVRRSTRAPWPVIALAAALQAGCAASKSPLASAAPIERDFAAAAVTWDLNRDGDVTCGEWKQYAAGLYQDADRNRDNLLAPDEFVALARQDRLFQKPGLAYFDADGDGRLTLPELVDKPNPAFTLIDINGDCTLTPEERRRVQGPGARREPGAAAPSGGRRRPGI